MLVQTPWADADTFGQHVASSAHAEPVVASMPVVGWPPSGVPVGIVVTPHTARLTCSVGHVWSTYSPATQASVGPQLAHALNLAVSEAARHAAWALTQ
jgi:hypothetical protein